MPTPKLVEKEELIAQISTIFEAGWHKSVKSTIDNSNDGAVGNTLEKLLGIPENNLPIPNAREWELKGQRSHTKSLVTLKHVEPSPRASKIVPLVLLPKYGWPHKNAGKLVGEKTYPSNERSFRSTTSALSPTNRGFQVVVDRRQEKLRFVFDSAKADSSDPEIAVWLAAVKRAAGNLGPLVPEPYWGFDDLGPLIATKLLNCFYVVAETKKIDGREYFKYVSLYVLSGFSFDKFLDAMESGAVFIDFDARTGHNHGTKFRLKQGYWTHLYSDVKKRI